MAAINEIHTLEVSVAQKRIVAALLWDWILANGHRKFVVKLWFLRKTVYIRDLHDVFALLLGPMPVDHL